MLPDESTAELPSDTENATLFSTGASLTGVTRSEERRVGQEAAAPFALMQKHDAVSPQSGRKRLLLAAVCVVVNLVAAVQVCPLADVWNTPWLTPDTV